MAKEQPAAMTPKQIKIPKSNSAILRVKINQESLDAFNELKASRKYRYIILKLSDNLKEIVLDSTGEPTADYEEFRNILIVCGGSPKRTPKGAVRVNTRLTKFSF